MDLVADIPNTSLTDDAPRYRRPMAEPAYIKEAQQLSLAALGAPAAAPEVFRRLLASPGIASKRWVYRQYHHMVRTNTLVLPGMGAGVVRIKGTSRALALSVDCNARFVYLDPFAGAQLAVAEAARNVACAGGQPIGATNCLNFGNPERPDIMWQFARAVEGMGAACRALDVPITGGNVSLYNETDGSAVLPTPTLGVVGLLEDANAVVRRTFQSAGDAIVLFGDESRGAGRQRVLEGDARARSAACRRRSTSQREAALQRLLVAAAASRPDSIGARLCRGRARGDARGVVFRYRPRGRRRRRRCDAVHTSLCATLRRLFGESASRVVVSVAPERVDELLSLARRRARSRRRRSDAWAATASASRSRDVWCWMNRLPRPSGSGPPRSNAISTQRPRLSVH